MKTIRRVVLVLSVSLILAVLCSCAASETVEPALSYSEWLSSVKWESGEVLSDVMNTGGKFELCKDALVFSGGWGDSTVKQYWAEESYRPNRVGSCDLNGANAEWIDLKLPQPSNVALEKENSFYKEWLKEHPETIPPLEEREFLEPWETGPKADVWYQLLVQKGTEALHVLVSDYVDLRTELRDPEYGLLYQYQRLWTQYSLGVIDEEGVLQRGMPLQTPEQYAAYESSDNLLDSSGNLWQALNFVGDFETLPKDGKTVLLKYDLQTGQCAWYQKLPDTVDYIVGIQQISNGVLVLGQTKDYDCVFYIVEVQTQNTTNLQEVTLPEEIADLSFPNMVSSNEVSDNVLLWTKTGICQWNVTAGQAEEFLRWQDYSVRFSTDPEAVLALPDGSFLIVVQKTIPGPFEFIKLTPTQSDSLQGRQTVTVAVTGTLSSLVQQAANDYNYTNPAKLVKVLDYSDAAAAAKGFASGSEMLNDDIISGNVPDIVLTSAENITSHIRKGLFADLYPYIDADVEMSREDFVAGALAATEQDGTLPTVLLAYNLLTAVGDPDVVGSTPGWTWEEFYSVLAANPQAKTPYYLYDRYYVLLYQLMLGGSDYLDYSTGAAHLDSPEFVRVLESSAAYPAENGDYTADPKPVFAAQQSLLNIQFVGDFRSVIAQNYAFDGPVVYKGFPSDAGGGSAFTSVLRGGITSYCTDPDAAWQFLRTLLLPEFQDNIQHSLPVRRDSLQKLAQAAAEPGQMAGLPPYLAGVTLTESQQEYWKRGITEEESTALLDLIESTDVLYQYDSTIAAILWEEADYFYNGVRTAEEAAALIQNRVQTYLAEQG